MYSNNDLPEFLAHLLTNASQPGDRLPALSEMSAELGMSVGKLREQLEIARTLGLIEASPRRGITRTAYTFSPPVRLSLLTALSIDRHHFDAFSSLRIHLEVAYWNEAVLRLTSDDKSYLRVLVAQAWEKLNQLRIQIPYPEHRELHMTIFRRLQNPFVLGLLDAYWDGYEAVELHTYTDYNYLQKVWRYHEAIVETIVRGDYDEGRKLLIEHMQLLTDLGISIEGLDSASAFTQLSHLNGGCDG